MDHDNNEPVVHESELLDPEIMHDNDNNNDISRPNNNLLEDEDGGDESEDEDLNADEEESGLFRREDFGIGLMIILIFMVGYFGYCQTQDIKEILSILRNKQDAMNSYINTGSHNSKDDAEVKLDIDSQVFYSVSKLVGKTKEDLKAIITKTGAEMSRMLRNGQCGASSPVTANTTSNPYISFLSIIQSKWNVLSLSEADGYAELDGLSKLWDNMINFDTKLFKQSNLFENSWRVVVFIANIVWPIAFCCIVILILGKCVFVCFDIVKLVTLPTADGPNQPPVSVANPLYTNNFKGFVLFLTIILIIFVIWLVNYKS